MTPLSWFASVCLDHMVECESPSWIGNQDLPDFRFADPCRQQPWHDIAKQVAVTISAISRQLDFHRGVMRQQNLEGYSKPHVSEKKNSARAASYASR
jgi:hypothetical protein